MGTLALIALGSNLGDRRATLDRAVAGLAETPGVVVQAVSRYHETAPIGGPGGQGAFLNAATALETTLDPFALHRRMGEIEQQAGRVRDIRWDARTLDLDLILFGDRIIESDDLIVPHPRFSVRRFVLDPLAEVAPDAMDPLTGRSVLDLLLRLDRRPSYLAIDGPTRAGLSSRVAERMAVALGADARLRGQAQPGGRNGSDHQPRIEQIEAGLRDLADARGRLWSSFDDRWIVTDYCLRLDLHRLALDAFLDQDWSPSGPRSMGNDPRLAEISAKIASAPSPTFCVAIGFRDWSTRLGSTTKAVDFPLLIPGATDEDGIVDEVAAACRATRP